MLCPPCLPVSVLLHQKRDLIALSAEPGQGDAETMRIPREQPRARRGWRLQFGGAPEGCGGQLEPPGSHFPVGYTFQCQEHQGLRTEAQMPPCALADVRGWGHAGSQHLLSVCKEVSHMGATGQTGKTLSNVTRDFCFQRLCDLDISHLCLIFF